MTSMVSEVPKMNNGSNECAKKSPSDDQIDVKTEFKSAIDETLTTVCHVASMSDLGTNDAAQKDEDTVKAKRSL